MADRDPGIIEIEVAYAQPNAQTVVVLEVPVGTTIAEAIIRSGIAAHTAIGDEHTVRVGVYGKRMSLSVVLHDHDRVEIYRPLIVDPKQARRKRARRRQVNPP